MYACLQQQPLGINGNPSLGPNPDKLINAHSIAQVLRGHWQQIELEEDLICQSGLNVEFLL